MARHWLPHWLKRTSHALLRIPQAKGLLTPRSFRPMVELLERRELLTVSGFTAGDLVVNRVGTGTGSLSSAATTVFLDEFTTATGQSAPVISIALPTSVSGSNHILTESRSASSEGALNRSADGRYLTLVGYDAAPGTTSVASSTVGRVVGRVDSTGTSDTSTLVDGYSGNNIRSAVSSDGTAFWTGGPVGTGGTHYVTLGNSGAIGSSVQVNAVNDRVVEIFNGQLYASSNTGGNTGINTIGTGLPTTSNQTMTRLPNVTDGNPLAYTVAGGGAMVVKAKALGIAV